jgi:hypothetical protein
MLQSACLMQINTNATSMQVINGLAGGLAGAVTATFVCPLDVLKTRLQVQRRVPGVKYHSIGGVLRGFSARL